MKISIISDCHLNKAVYKSVSDREFTNLPFRTADFMRALKYMINKSIDMEVDLVVIPGDIYDNFDPSNEVRGFFSSQVKKLCDAKIPVIILIGNHDVCMKHHALKDIKELGLKTIRVYEKPSIVKFKGHKLLLFPYSLDIEQQNVTVKDEFYSFLKKVQDNDEKLPTMFFGHFGVKGGKLNEYLRSINVLTTDTTTTECQVKTNYINTNPNDISCDDLDKLGAEYVILGDYHEHQILKTKKCIAMYTGSIEKTDITEITQKKGFILYDSEAEEIEYLGKCRFIEYPNCRPMIELKGSDITELRQKFDSMDHSKYQNAIVKISFKGKSDALLTFSIGLDAFKKDIKQKINAIHVFHQQGIENEDQREEASRIEQQIMERGHIEETDVIDVVKDMIVEKIDDDTEQKITVDLAVDIYNEARG